MINILSLFDGISVAQQAMINIGLKYNNYYASEIDKYAIQITQKNHPYTIQIGDVKNVYGKYYHDIYLMIGGSPCQDLSIAKAGRKGLSGEKSRLFWEYVRILQEVQPKYFILENVASMSKAMKELISFTIGVEPVMINATLVSAQNRKRLFWTNIPNIIQPKDRNIMLKDILQTNIEYEYDVGDDFKIGKSRGNRLNSIDGKGVTLSANGGGGGAKTGLYRIDERMFLQGNSLEREFGRGATYQEQETAWDSYNKRLIKDKCPTLTEPHHNATRLIGKDYIRKLTPIECERLQSLPDNYTEGVSNTQRYKSLGNAFNCAVIEHILSFIPMEDYENASF